MKLTIRKRPPQTWQNKLSKWINHKSQSKYLVLSLVLMGVAIVIERYSEKILTLD